MKNCKVSVIMSVYKEPIEWLSQSIDSILNQTFKDFEFIIICDNPSYQEGKSLLNDYYQKDSRIILMYNDVNIGLTKSLNKGLAIARGEYIARMDADDVSLPERFKMQVEYLDANPNVIVLGTQIKYFGDVRFGAKSDWIYTTNEECKAQLIFNSCFVHPSVMIRAGVLRSQNILYDESYKQTQDYRMWEMIKDYGDFSNLQECLLYYRLNKHQVSNINDRNQLRYSSSIRRRILCELLKDTNIDPMNLNILHDRKKILVYFGKGRPVTFMLLKLLYFTNKKNKKRAILMSIMNGDFFHFSFLDKFRMLALFFGKKSYNLL